MGYPLRYYPPYSRESVVISQGCNLATSVTNNRNFDSIRSWPYDCARVQQTGLLKSFNFVQPGTVWCIYCSIFYFNVLSDAHIVTWSKVLQNLIGPQQVMKLPTFCRTQRFMPVLTTAYHWSLS